MTITIAQLNILAEKYNFDIDDARLTIGLPPTSRRGRPVKVVEQPKSMLESLLFPSSVSGSGSMNSDMVKPKKSKSVGTNVNLPVKKSKKEIEVSKKPTTKRGPTGYQLYMAEVRPRVVADLQNNLKLGEKNSPGAVMSEIGKRWKNLPDSSRDLWNKKAATVV